MLEQSVAEEDTQGIKVFASEIINHEKKAQRVRRAELSAIHSNKPD
jgi:hypothetical protein